MVELRTMKILIYGFRPFKKYKKNISEEVVKNLVNKRKFIKVILPIVYKKKYILNKIKKYQLDVIIGFGQSAGKLIRIEKRAKNIFEMERPKGKRVIDSTGPKLYSTNLKLKKIPGARISYNADDYLCNFTMYVILDFIKKENLKTRSAFIHIPKNYNLKKATRVIQELIRDISS